MHPLRYLLHHAPRFEEEGILPLSREVLVSESAPSSNLTKVGCLILAGGQGTRLGFKGPKGCTLIPGLNQTLFEHLLRKVKMKGENLPVAIMTSPLNHEETKAYLSKHHYFGLSNLSLFSQEMVDVCNARGELIDSMQSPDGNGRALFSLQSSGILKEWKQGGVQFVQVIPIDNPLAEPFDGELLSLHEQEGVDLALRAVVRQGLSDKIGVIGLRNQRLTICEYSELPERLKHEDFLYGNSGLFSLSISLIEKLLHLKLPWHLAKKKIEGREVIKFETFIFDLFPHAPTFKVLISERKKHFAPIKNLRGLDSLESVSKTHFLAP